MELKIIKTKAEHANAIAALTELMDGGAELDSRASNELEVLAALIEKYEEERFPVDLPGPVEAIRFRMEQNGLVQKDLVPFIGSPSRVSEVLNGKRTLSLSMIRNLSEGLGIPAKVLISGEETICPNDEEVDWTKFPLSAMKNQGYFGIGGRDTISTKDQYRNAVRSFFSNMDLSFVSEPALLRSAVHQRQSTKKMNWYAMLAWQARILQRSEDEKIDGQYQEGSVNLDFMRRLAQQSWSTDGPVRAKEYLGHHGIHLITEPHLPKTYLDGAALWGPNGQPIVALTLRHDRLDNFWFTLMHELAHIALHLGKTDVWFIDDLDSENSLDGLEQEADELASRALVPDTVWDSSPKNSVVDIKALASKLGIHPAIVAGRAQRESNNYRTFSNLVGRHKVRQHFRQQSPAEDRE